MFACRNPTNAPLDAKKVPLLSSVQLEEKTHIKSQSMRFCLTHFKESIHQFLSFIPPRPLRAEKGEGMKGDPSGAVCCRPIKGASFMLVCCSKGLPSLLNKYQKVCWKMVTCLCQSDSIFRWRGLTRATSCSYFWMLFYVAGFVSTGAVCKLGIKHVYGLFFFFSFVMFFFLNTTSLVKYFFTLRTRRHGIWVKS